MGSKSFKIDHPDGTFVTPSGKTVTVRGGMATVEDTAPQAPTPQSPQSPQSQPQLGDEGYQDNYTGLAGSVRSYADAATGGLPTYANAGLETLYDQLKGRFGGTPSGTGWKESWDQNLGMEQKRARSAASQHKMDAVAGQILSPANLVPGLPIATGASYANALGEDPLVGAAWGTIPVAGQGIAKGAKTISKYGPAVVKGLREGDGPYLRSVLKAIKETNAAQPKPLPEMPRRPPSMRGPQEPVPEAPPVEPTVDPRIRGRVESLPRNAPKTEVTPVDTGDTYQQPAQWDRLRAPKTTVDPVPVEPPPEVPDDGMLAKLQQMVEQNKRPTTAVSDTRVQNPGISGETQYYGTPNPGVPDTGVSQATPDKIRALMDAQNAAQGPAKVYPSRPPTPVPAANQALADKADDMQRAWLQGDGPKTVGGRPSNLEKPWEEPVSAENDVSWLDRLRGRLKELVGQDGNVAKAMENPEARIRARGGD